MLRWYEWFIAHSCKSGWVSQGELEKSADEGLTQKWQVQRGNRRNMVILTGARISMLKTGINYSEGEMSSTHWVLLLLPPMIFLTYGITNWRQMQLVIIDKLTGSNYVRNWPYRRVASWGSSVKCQLRMSDDWLCNNDSGQGHPLD